MFESELEVMSETGNKTKRVYQKQKRRHILMYLFDGSYLILIIPISARKKIEVSEWINDVKYTAVPSKKDEKI